MNHAQLAQRLSEDLSIPQSRASQALKDLFGTISGALESGDTVVVHGFGSFQPKDRPARQGRNPRTGEAIRIPASRTAAFRPSKVLKDRLAA